MSNPKISVIVPVYNVEDYITETLESLLSQTIIDDIEVIMVDDGSTDESRYIIEKYALDYANFHAYHKENEGLPITRNYGMKYAKGDYIHFLDSDDYLPADGYEKLYGLALKNDSDIVIGKTLKYARYNVWDIILFDRAFDGIKDDVDLTTLSKLPQILWDTISCDKIYKKEFLEKNNITFIDKRILFEDIIFTLEAYILAERISISKDPFYYWRFRNDNSSITQQEMDVKNIKDRLEILRLSQEIMDRYDVSEDILNHEYDKWMNHDLKYFITRFDSYPKEDYEELFNKIYKLVERIPDELIDGYNTYKKVLFKMIKNNDFDNFILFAPMEKDLYSNPVIPSFIDDEYKDYFDFKKAAKDEELIVEISDVDYDKDSLFIKFNGMINYLTDEKYEIRADLMDSANQYPLEVNIKEDSQIIVPLALIKGKSNLMINVFYEFDDFKKEGLLKNRKRRSIELDDYYVDLNIGENSYLYIDSKQKTNNHIEISEIKFINEEFIISGNSIDRISEIYIQNVIDFNKIPYPVEYGGNSKEFSFRMPSKDLLNGVIKKWEMNCDESQNSIKLKDSFTCYTKFNKIRFINSRNKILIEHDICNILDEINEGSSSGYSEKSQLIKENEELKKKLSEFKSRKVIKFADKLKFNR